MVSEADSPQPACNEQGHPELDQTAQSPIQPDLGCFQGWGIYHLSGQPVPISPPSPQKKIFCNFFPGTEHITAPLSIVCRVQLNTATISEACSDMLQDELKMML